MKLSDNELLQKSSLDSVIQRCDFCEISKLPFNKYNFNKGTGKLIGWGGKSKTKFFFVGLNPSYRRFPEQIYAFGGDRCEFGTGKEFIEMLRELKLLDRSYITNLVKCSTTTNQVEQIHMNNCFMHLLNEIELVKPKRIIALGKEVGNFLKKSEKISSDLIHYIYHPNYIFSYQRELINEYREQIKEACLNEEV